MQYQINIALQLRDTVEFVTIKDNSQWEYVTNVLKGFLGKAIASILNASQDFMRNTKVSFLHYVLYTNQLNHVSSS